MIDATVANDPMNGTNAQTSSERKAGDVVAGATLAKLIGTTAQHQVWRAEAEGAKVAVYMLAPSATEEDAYRFHAAALKMLKVSKAASAGVLRVRGVEADGRAFVADLWAGNVGDLPALAWELDRRLALYRELCSAVQTIHASALVHGGLAPSSVLLDDDLHPVIAAMEVDDAPSLLAAPTRAPYVAPELASGKSPSVASDVFALGQILHFLLLDKDPSADADEVPRLDDLAPTAPAGLVRIVRKCISVKVARRYANVADLASDVSRYAEWNAVGVAHPDVIEANTGATFAQQPPAHAPAVAAAPEPRRAPPKPTEARGPATMPKGRAVNAPRAAMKVIAPSWARYAALAGALAIGVAIVLGYVSGSHAIVWRILSSLGVGAIGLMIPIDATRARLGAGAALVVLGFFIDLGGRATIAGASTALASPNPQSAAAAMRALRSAGAKKFSNANVSGGDFSGMDFEGAECDFVDFSSANLSNTTFVRATLVGAIMRDANLEGAVMTDANIMMIIELDQAKCDARTKLPTGWHCENGHPHP